LAALYAVGFATGDESRAPDTAASVLLALTWAAEDNDAAVQAEADHQAALLRDLFGPLPFREVRPRRAWLAWNGGTVKCLAEGIYQERALPSGHLDTTMLAVLADALEEAGCRDSDVLSHCREQGRVHVRGCWVVDLLLQKG
jgi:hypothetical protein